VILVIEESVEVSITHPLSESYSILHMIIVQY